MSGDEHRLQIVEDAAGRRGAFGDAQSAWLLENEIVERAGYEQTGPLTGIDFYRVIDDAQTIDDVNALVIAQAELRECDFCSTIPAGWQLAVVPFTSTMMPGTMGRPIFLCDDCAPLVKANDRPALIERRIQASIDEALRQGGAVAATVAGVPRSVVNEQVGPLVREFVDAVLANAVGDPEVAT